MEQHQPTLQELQANSLQILAKAAENYVLGLDELARNFVAPQIQAAINHLAQLVQPMSPQGEEPPPPPPPPSPPAPAKRGK